MAKSPAFQFYPGDWLSSTDVSLMSPAEEGAYIRLLCHAWQQVDCGLPDDDETLSILSRLGDNWNGRSSQRVRAKFVSREGRLFNERLLQERGKQDEWRRKSAEAGKASAKKREDSTKKQPPLNQRSTTVEPPLENGCDMVGDLVQPSGQPSSNSSVFCLLSSVNTKTPPTPPGGDGPQEVISPFERLLPDIAEQIHTRHPDAYVKISVNAVASKLKTICGKVPKSERVSRLHEINDNHIAMCLTEQWQEEGGAHAKSLENWLAPTMGRFDSKPTAQQMPKPKSPSLNEAFRIPDYGAQPRGV